MAAPFKASIITPEAIVLETPVTSAQVPAADGLIGLLTHRAPLLAKLTTGVLRLDTPTGVQRFLITGGYAQMKDDDLTILTTEAIPAAQITAQSISAEQAKLSAVQGNDLEAMEKRSAIESRVHAMRTLVA